MKRLLATLAAALAATVIAAPVAAQTTGTITSSVDGFTFPETATLNGNREWEITYSADLSPVIEGSVRICKNDSSINQADCVINPPYIMRYGVWSGGNCLFASQPQSAIQGISGTIPLTAWTQTLRAKPGTSYCLAMYSSYPSYYSNRQFAAAYFTTPADPNPPASPWNPNPLGQGCGAETSLDYVQQCYRCKYQGTAETWNFNTNRCVSAGN